MPTRSEDLSGIYYERPHFCVDEQLYPESRGFKQHQFASRNAAQAYVSGVAVATRIEDKQNEERHKAVVEFSDFCRTKNGEIAKEFDKQNPLVYQLFEKYAAEMKQTGREKYSAQAIIERIRWHMALTTVGDDFKINNNHSPYYARKLMAQNIDYLGFFNLRSRQT